MSNEGFEGLSEYSDLLENPQILNVIELSERQKGQLMKYIKQLETKDTTDWEDLQKPNNVPLTKNDVKTVWLRRVAVALYHEVNDTFPWKITDYKQEHLDLLLRLKIENAPKPLLESKTSMDFKEIGTDTYIFHNLVWSANPIQSMKIMQIIMKKYKPDTPQAALYSLIDYMCELGWVHFDVAKKIHNTDWDKLPYHTLPYN